MEFVLGLAPCGFPKDGNALLQVDHFACLAKQHGVSLLVFPENLMCPHELSLPELIERAESLDGAFVQTIRQTARTHGLWIVFTMYETSPAHKLPYNTAVVVDGQGSLRGLYRKCHLYDAHNVRESERMAAGDRLCDAIHAPFGTFGVGICYDLRFPEVARALALKGCDLVLFPAAWHDGPHKLEHWETLLRARAIENECFVAGVCHGGPRYVNVSIVCDSMGRVVARSTGDLTTCAIDLETIRATREAMPIFEHRKPPLYQPLAQGDANL
jgi:predicted amidohydrolase